MEIIVKNGDKYYHSVISTDDLTCSKCALRKQDRSKCADSGCSLNTYFVEIEFKPRKKDIYRVLKLIKKVHKANLTQKELVDYIFEHWEDKTKGNS